MSSAGTTTRVEVRFTGVGVGPTDGLALPLGTGGNVMRLGDGVVGVGVANTIGSEG
jgi:hypothetical protein